MAITLLDLYNTTASQEWAMYDNDAISDDEFEASLVLALNKAIVEILSSYDFPFRERTHIILTIPGVEEYDMPNGIIKRDKKERYKVRYNSKILDFIEYTTDLEDACGVPEGFYIRGDKIVFYPTPAEKGLVTIDYMTLAIGETASGTEIYSLQNEDDVLSVPAHLEELMKQAIISRAMLNSIASETDENYSAYKKQADKALKLLIKYSKVVTANKKLNI